MLTQNIGDLIPAGAVPAATVTPMQKWVEKNKIHVAYGDQSGLEEPYAVWTGHYTWAAFESGPTLEAALRNWAAANKQKLWEGA